MAISNPMKIFTNLPGNLRALFAFLRGVIIISGLVGC